MECKKCGLRCIRKGYAGGIQKYYCKNCKLHQREQYLYKRFTSEDKKELIRLNNLGLGTTGIGEVMRRPKTVINYWIKNLGRLIRIPVLKEQHCRYEVDELQTFARDKDNEVYVFYGIEQQTRKVTGLAIGRRTQDNALKVVGPIHACSPRRIYTDRLNIYPGIVSKEIHRTFKTQINRIERKNLTLRTKIKRLNRQTLCFSKKVEMLEACLKIYFWGHLLVL